MARTKLVRRWRRNMEVSDDTEYVDMLTTLSEGSVRRNFNPYTDIDWDSPEFAALSSKRTACSGSRLTLKSKADVIVSSL